MIARLRGAIRSIHPPDGRRFRSAHTLTHTHARTNTALVFVRGDDTMWQDLLKMTLMKFIQRRTTRPTRDDGATDGLSVKFPSSESRTFARTFVVPRLVHSARTRTDGSNDTVRRCASSPTPRCHRDSGSAVIPRPTMDRC